MTDTAVPPKRAAAIIGFCVTSLANWRAKGIGPKYFKVGPQRIYYRVEDLERFKQGEPVSD